MDSIEREREREKIEWELKTVILGNEREPYRQSKQTFLFFVTWKKEAVNS